jgi:hypothetical protein
MIGIGEINKKSHVKTVQMLKEDIGRTNVSFAKNR